jgi:hypothetical protein
MSRRTLSQTREGHILRNNKEEFLISLAKQTEAGAEKAAKQLLEEQTKKYKRPEEGQKLDDMESNKDVEIKGKKRRRNLVEEQANNKKVRNEATNEIFEKASKCKQNQNFKLANK